MNERDRLQKLAEEHFRSLYERLPIQATLLGIHQYDRLLGDMSSESIAQLVADCKARLTELRRIDRYRLGIHDAVEYDLVQADIHNNLIWFEELADWQRDPNFYVDTPLYGLFALLVRDFAPAEERARSVLARLKALPGFLRLGTTNVLQAPRTFVEVAIETAEGGLQFFQETIPAFAEQVPTLRTELLEANEEAASALASHLDYLRSDLLPGASDAFAIGREMFEKKLRWEHMLGLSVEQLRALGQRVFTETERALREMADRIDPRKTWPELVEEARNDHPSADDLLGAFGRELARLRQFIADRGIVTIPSNEKLQLVDTPAFARSTIPYAAYMPPAPFEESQQGQFWVTPLDANGPPERRMAHLRENCHGTLPLTALHEAYPGHHLQLVRSNNVSSTIRKHISSNLFAEGWAFYCEQLMGEVGYYRDWRPRLFQLKDQLWRAARVLIDVDMQTGKMSFEQAVRLLVEQAHLTEGAALTEVRRYAMTPTQPMSYLAGKQQILNLRAEFSSLPMKDFHDGLLSSGTIPVELVRREMRVKLGR